MSSTEISMETIIEDEDSFVSNANAIIYAASDISGWTQSLISDNNIPNSLSSTSVEEHHHHQQISTAAGDGDSMIVSSSASCSSFNNEKKIDDQQEIRIFNVDFRALCHKTQKSCSRSELRSRNGGDDDDSMIVSSSASSTWFMNNQQEIRIFNVDFGALCHNRLQSCPGSEFRSNAGNDETSVSLAKTLMRLACRGDPREQLKSRGCTDQ